MSGFEREGEERRTPSGKGYSKGSVPERGAAAVSGIRASPSASVPFAPFLREGFTWKWKLIENAGFGFDLSSQFTASSSEDSPPGPSEHFLSLAAAIPCCHQEAIQRIIESHTQGRWAAHHLHTRTSVAGDCPIYLSKPAQHFLILRAPGVGDYVRLHRQADFDFLCSPPGASVLTRQTLKCGSSVHLRRFLCLPSTRDVSSQGKVAPWCQG